MSYTKGSIAGGWIHVSHGKTQIALVHPKYVDAFVAVPELYEACKASTNPFLTQEEKKIIIDNALAKVEGGE